MLEIDAGLSIPLKDIEIAAIRAQGAGGQNVNKVASAVHLRFDSQRCEALPDELKASLLALADRRIGRDGVIVIKSQRYRTREKNRRDALERLRTVIVKAQHKPKPRKATRPGRRAREERLKDKAHRARVKGTRGPVTD